VLSDSDFSSLLTAFNQSFRLLASLGTRRNFSIRGWRGCVGAQRCNAPLVSLWNGICPTFRRHSAHSWSNLIKFSRESYKHFNYLSNHVKRIPRKGLKLVQNWRKLRGPAESPCTLCGGVSFVQTSDVGKHWPIRIVYFINDFKLKIQAQFRIFE